MNEVDQFTIDFKNKKDKLVDFLNNFAINHRVNIRIPYDITETEINILIAIHETKKYNIAILYTWYYNENETIEQKVKNAGIPFYYSYLISNWDELIGFCNIGVSDVFITNQLGFELDKVSEVLSEKGIQIRAYANVSQEGWNQDGVKGFYIRPDDVAFLSNFIDVIEFYDSIDRQNILYTIYFHDGKWVGNLQEVIKGLKVPVYNYYIMDGYIERRFKCGKRCLKGNHCNYCYRAIELAQTLKDNPDIEFIRTKREVEEEDG